MILFEFDENLNWLHNHPRREEGQLLILSGTVGLIYRLHQVIAHQWGGLE